MLIRKEPTIVNRRRDRNFTILMVIILQHTHEKFFQLLP